MALSTKEALEAMKQVFRLPPVRIWVGAGYVCTDRAWMAESLKSADKYMHYYKYDPNTRLWGDACKCEYTGYRTPIPAVEDTNTYAWVTCPLCMPFAQEDANVFHISFNGDVGKWLQYLNKCEASHFKR